jgi:putative ABC transport system substrate-binding protein
MRRREFITLLGGAAAWVSPARAQEPRRVVGVLASFGFPSLFFSEVAMPPFLQGLKNAGFVEGRNINIEIRQVADGHYDRLPSLAAELVGRDVAAIFAADLPSAFAAKAATKTIPIVVLGEGRVGPRQNSCPRRCECGLDRLHVERPSEVRVRRFS